jgi:hypothetical protein
MVLMRRKILDRIIRWTDGSFFANWLANVLVYNGRFLSILPNRYADERYDYTAESHALTKARPLRFNDLEGNFFIRLVLEQQYSHVIEIGAYHLERAAGIARLFPSVAVYGLDITKDFASEREINGVHIGPNTSQQIRTIAQRHGSRGLICCRGTLVYYDQLGLMDLLAVAHSVGHDIALSEPNGPLTPYLSQPRPRTYRTWYHNFPKMLAEAGYTVMDGGSQIQCSISEYGEERTFIFAQAKACFQVTP